ncbi:hypothetical protein BZA05DRAFT_408035 [Tricharina praecox]|uniref:uncharacterized protein n=1 Tax=Tricharina praecox TaxID=43433 RepID=UPI00221E5844|nr:uncharacterized protein BZA05DRAFT_408035 [Tricharina praecox]KAI5845547.1 hypothetical protein BZA05DRAFT_408035 [Tricharina praecox]
MGNPMRSSNVALFLLRLCISVVLARLVFFSSSAPSSPPSPSTENFSPIDPIFVPHPHPHPHPFLGLSKVHTQQLSLGPGHLLYHGMGSAAEYLYRYRHSSTVGGDFSRETTVGPYQFRFRFDD